MRGGAVALFIVGVGLRRRCGAAGGQSLQVVVSEIPCLANLGDLIDIADAVVAVAEVGEWIAASGNMLLFRSSNSTEMRLGAAPWSVTT